MVCEEESLLELETETAPPSSPELLTIDSSAESTFRELDYAFLQSQTRIWLGEVLQIRLDEELIISELLADGELLFQVSKVVWKLLLAKHTELRHMRAYRSHPFASKRNSGRYRPYSNVDSFLKICKILGLTGVDLFSPSDVVDRRNTRKVCMCIRSFSKKSRSMNINVPDFDIVTCMVSMSKDAVGCIRRSIELSHSTLIDSSSHHLHKHTRGKSRQGYGVTRPSRDYKTYSDHSDDTEITHPVLQINGLHSDDLYDYKSEIDYNMQSLMVDSDFVTEDLDQLDIQNQQRSEIYNDEFELLSSMESLQDYCSDNIEHEHDSKLMTWPSSSSCGDLNVDFIGMTSHLDTRVHQVQESMSIDFDYFEDVLLRNNASVIETPTNDKTSVTDATSYAKNRKDPDLSDEESSTPDVHQSASSHGSNPTPQTIDSGGCFDVCDNIPLGLGDQFNTERNAQNIESFKLSNDKSDQWDKTKKYEAQGVTKFKEIEHSLYSPDCYFCSTNCSDRAVHNGNDISSTLLKKSLAYEDRESQLDNASCTQSEELQSRQSYYLPEFCKWDQKGKCVVSSNRAKINKSSSCFLEDGSHKETIPCKRKPSEVLMSNEEEIVSAAVIKLDSDGKELNTACVALAPSALGVDNCEECVTLGGDADNLYSKGVITQEIGDRGQRILDMRSNDVVASTNCDEDVPSIGCGITDQSSKHESNDGHQECQHDKDPVYHPEHTHVVHIKEEIKPEDESVHSENLVEPEEEGIEIPKSKPQKKLLLRSVLGGTTAVGLLFMFLHLRRNGGEKGSPTSKTSSHKDKEKIQKIPPQKAKRISTAKSKGVYPAENINLK